MKLFVLDMAWEGAFVVVAEDLDAAERVAIARNATEPHLRCDLGQHEWREFNLAEETCVRLYGDL